MARETETVAAFRDMVLKKYGVERSSYLCVRVQDNEVQQYHSSNKTLENVKD